MTKAVLASPKAPRKAPLKEPAVRSYSLANPDLRGLFSVAHLPGATSWWGKLKGSLPLLALISSWCLGTWVPLYVAYLIYQGGAAAGWGIAVATVHKKLTSLFGAKSAPRAAPCALLLAVLGLTCQPCCF
jgi:hypothetical protein